jgi:hypothetical protein
MRKFTLWTRLGVDPDIERKSDSLSREDEKLKADTPKVKAKAMELDEPIFLAYEATRRANIVGADNFGTLNIEYHTIRDRKNNILHDHQRALDSNLNQRGALMSPIKEETQALLDGESKKMMDLYICEVPVSRPHPFLKEKDGSPKELPGVRTDHAGNQYLDIKTNAGALVEAKKILAETKVKVRDCLSTKELEKVLTEADEALNKINFDAKSVTVRYEEFERLDHSRASEVAFLRDKTALFTPKK